MYTSPLAPGGCQGEPMPSPLDSPGAVPARNLNVPAFPPGDFSHHCNARFPFLTIGGMAPQPHYARKSFRIRSYKNTGGWGWSRLRLPSTFCRPFIFITLQDNFLATRSIHVGLVVSRSSL